MARCMVTGGAGFIGSHLCRRLVAEGHDVRVLDNLSSGRRENIAEIQDVVEFVEGDLCDEELLAEVIQGVDCVLHHAARRVEVCRVVFAASAAAYGNNPQVPKREEMPPEPELPYAISKIMGEYYAWVYTQIYGLEVVCLRYFNVFGPLLIRASFRFLQNGCFRVRRRLLQEMACNRAISSI